MEKQGREAKEGTTSKGEEGEEGDLGAQPLREVLSEHVAALRSRLLGEHGDTRGAIVGISGEEGERDGTKIRNGRTREHAIETHRPSTFNVNDRRIRTVHFTTDTSKKERTVEMVKGEQKEGARSKGGRGDAPIPGRGEQPKKVELLMNYFN